MDIEDVNSQNARDIRPGAVVAGLVVLAVGVTMLMNATGVADIRIGRLFAPLVLIALGSAIVLEKAAFVCGRRDRDSSIRARARVRQRRGSAGGFWLIGVGVWMLVSQTHMFGLSFHSSWPLLIIFAGLIITSRGLR
jgi:hypothetical protein